MSYRYGNDGGCIGVIVWVIGFPIFIGMAIQHRLFPETNGVQYWILYTGTVIALIGLLYGYTLISNKIQKKKEQYKLYNTLCEHGIKGGKTLMLCPECKEQKEKDRLKYELVEAARERKKRIKENAAQLRNEEIVRFTKINLANKDFLYKATPNEFEDLIAQMYKKLGYEVKQTPYSNDKGKDIILKKEGIKYLVECKRYSPENTIGREALQKFFAAIIEDKAEKGFFVTTSDYKSTAVKYAKDISKIELINGSKLVLMMREIYPENYESNTVKIMCNECGEIVQFAFNKDDKSRFCKNGHTVANDFDSEILSPKYLSNDKYCVKCGSPMNLVHWRGKQFWGCSRYPKCKSYQRHIEIA